jgi:flagellar biogenesis protein FliO
MFHTDIDISQWIIASGVLVLLLILFANALKFYINNQPQTALGMKKRRLKNVESLHLDAKNKITIVQFDDTEVVLGISPAGISIIGSQDAESPEAIEPTEETERMTGIGFLKRFVKNNQTEDTSQENTDPKTKDMPAKKKATKKK